MFRVGIDIGGTFTDFVVVNSKTGQVHVDKLPTSRGDPSIAFFQGLDRLVTRLGISPPEAKVFLHATTLASNAVIARTGAKTGLITTQGFESVLDIRKGLRYDQYDLKIQFPPPLVPRYLRRGLNERTLASGRILREVNAFWWVIGLIDPE